MLRKVALKYAFGKLVFILSVYQFKIKLRIEHVFDVGFRGSREVGEGEDAALLQEFLLAQAFNRLLILLLIVDQNCEIQLPDKRGEGRNFVDAADGCERPFSLRPIFPARSSRSVMPRM